MRKTERNKRQFSFRASAELVGKIDRYRREQGGAIPTVSVAIEALLELGFDAWSHRRRLRAPVSDQEEA